MSAVSPAISPEAHRSSTAKRLFLRWLLFLVLGVFALYYLAPMYVMIITSLKSMEEIRQGNLISLPKELLFGCVCIVHYSIISSAPCVIFLSLRKNKRSNTPKAMEKPAIPA